MAKAAKPEYRFGEKIKEIRESQGTTLKELAGRMDVSASLLSQIENNKVSPSIDTLLNLADILDIDPEYLFRDFRKKRKVRILHREERNSLTLGALRYEQLSPPAPEEGEYAAEVLQLEIRPGGEKGSTQFGHPGTERGVVLEGTAELLFGTETYSLREGDSLSFSSSVPHTLRNTGGGVFRAVWIITPPRMFSAD